MCYEEVPWHLAEFALLMDREPRVIWHKDKVGRMIRDVKVGPQVLQMWPCMCQGVGLCELPAIMKDGLVIPGIWYGRAKDCFECVVSWGSERKARLDNFRSDLAI